MCYIVLFIKWKLCLWKCSLSSNIHVHLEQRKLRTLISCGARRLYVLPVSVEKYEVCVNATFVLTARI